MSQEKISLNDRFDLSKSPVLLNGTQALVRLMLAQKARDEAAGLNTAGYVTGYRGSPLGAVDMQMRRAGKILDAAEVRFEEGLNEDLAATALWGAQQAHLRGEGRFDGVFGLWYGKGPGVDRSGDAMKHANMAGTAPHGGVLMAMGDDHTGESSTVLHQSEWALVDAYMPIVSPAGVQEILDLGIYGYALSRYAGVWVGLKTMKDTVEATSVVDGDPFRMKLVTPSDFPMPEGGVNIRLGDSPPEQEARMIDHKRFAAEAFARANRIDKRIWGKPGAKIGFVSAGKNYLDLVHALSLLGIDEAEAERLGITTYKVAQVWPLDMDSFHEWAEGLDLIVVVEEKRKLIEVQVKEAIFDDRRGRRVYGWRKGGAHAEELFPTKGALDPVWIAEKLGAILVEEGRGTEAVQAALTRFTETRSNDNVTDLAARLPYFCAGCPHNSSTKIPEGSRAYAGIGCHYMVQWMDRETTGFTHMGAEGANWIGEAPFSTRDHVFQNLGDGTYNHSGIQAIRAAQAAGVNMTYKILFNDAVAMTGGQKNEGGLTAYRIAEELKGMGLAHIAVVHDQKENIDLSQFPKGIEIAERADLEEVQRNIAKVKGVSALIYVQTCAAEKRRRRKRKEFPDPDQRVFINTDVCEGCGDCGVQSNCVAITPVETDFGRKRAIDQSACNKDFSCLNGFCPSFVTLEGAVPKKAPKRSLELPEGMDLPELPEIHGTHNIVLTGVGGTGVVTIGAVLAQAAQIDGKGAGMMEMAGLAQKGGAVHIHLRIGETPEDISAIRVAAGEAHALIGGDLVVSAGSKTLGLTRQGQTGAVVNSHEIVTGDFTRDTEFTLPSERLALQLQARLRDRVELFDASALAQVAMGDSIFANMILLGAAWQQGLVPLSHDAIRQAVTLNGAAVERNLHAFEVGRYAVLHKEEVAQLIAPAAQKPEPLSLDALIETRAAHLRKYQNRRLARRYRAMVDRFEDEELREAVARSYHKLLAYKDEYEVARMHLETRAKAREVFDGDFRISYHLAPPMLGGEDGTGRPKKRKFGPWMKAPFWLLARMKGLRGTRLDPFGRQAERRMERGLIRQFEQDMEDILKGYDPELKESVKALIELPMQIRGYGPVKAENEARAAKQREAYLAVLRDGPFRAAAE
ncbi:indolepyruvate ferredoxin oxidoreductase [Pseudooceanicola antarcticus]|uniref:Indolepyruvate ferredoxin oxidoreductase n=1 Tax=Pseudooceanicola antarcticus TaxID=1247613 RepID=A0A285J5W0_9RHOB|nr:indolepyruvate ferredoxin oxidoreductase family protein [Pseudooceanicola antarcticus]PJE26899.1 indolepyruvate ferredoxin oxidoreductase [Pseudooceanicola antarcticus]SNY55705.1 indolepyruvate ferredoxin oxidoreductase [Pseudooceanicola antarcticus]